MENQTNKTNKYQHISEALPQLTFGSLTYKFISNLAPFPLSASLPFMCICVQGAIAVHFSAWPTRRRRRRRRTLFTAYS